MTPRTSLRSRVLIASALWTAGLFLAVLLVSTALLLRFPSWARIAHGAAYTHAVAFVLIALALMYAGLWQVRKGLSLFDRLRQRLSAVREGRDQRIEGSYPAEVQPLVADLNALLDHREQMVRRAIAKAGDLAHGLKTPLAVLSQEAERARAAGQAELASTICQQVERMRRQMDYHLAHARAAASGATPGAHCLVISSAEPLARTLLRLHAERGISIELDLSPEHAVRCQREDLDEILGNLLDNACKWARSCVTVESQDSGDAIVILVDDDGPGLDPSMRDRVLLRGVRADEAAAGSGFGLAIVRDLAELYGGSISLGTASAGGLRATLRLPKLLDS